MSRDVADPRPERAAVRWIRQRVRARLRRETGRRSSNAELLLCVLTAVAGAAWLMSVASHGDSGWIALIAFVPLLVLGDVLAVQQSDGHIMLFGDAFIVAAAIVLAPADAAVALMVTALVLAVAMDDSLDHTIGRLGFTVPVNAVALAVVGLTKEATAFDTATGLLLAAVAGFAAMRVAEIVLFAAVEVLGAPRGTALRTRVENARSRPFEGFREVTLQTVLQVPLAVLVAAAASLSVWLVPFGVGPLFLGWRSARQQHVLERTNTQLEHVNERLLDAAGEMARGNLQFAAAMVRALDARDAYTAGHSAAVAVYTHDIAVEAGLDEATCRLAHLAGLVHDIGKIGIPRQILNKPGKLDDEEFEVIRRHPVTGAHILGEVDAYRELAMIVRHHHERIDGRGYPDRLEAEHIPVLSRVIAVADTYSALTTDRPYRTGMDPERAVVILASAAEEGQLDPLFTKRFLDVLERASDEYRRGKLQQFELEVAKHGAFSEAERRTLEETQRAA